MPLYRFFPTLPKHVAALVLRCLAIVSLAVASSSAITPNAQEVDLGKLFTGASGQQRPLTKYDPILNQVARARAQDMARRGYFNHVNPDGNGPNYLVKQAGYPLPAWWGSDRDANYVESIAGGQVSASATWSDFMGSSMHRQHLLAETAFHRDSTSYGIGYAADPGSKYRHYWVVITAPPRPLPALTVSSPKNNAQVGAPEVTFSGNAADKVKSLQTRIENDAGVTEYRTVAASKDWSVVVSGLLPGTNKVRVRGLDAQGNLLVQTVRTIRYIVGKPLTVAVSGSGKVTSGFLGTTQRQLGKRYTIEAKPVGDAVFVGWSGSISGSSRKLSFDMSEGLVLTANFVPNPFRERNGRYSGVLLGNSTAGTASLEITRGGSFSGSVVIDGARHSVRGKLGLDGKTSVTLRRKNDSPVTIELALDVAGNRGLSISVAGETASSNGEFARALKKTAGSPVQPGRYTVALSRDPDAAAHIPQGHGYITMKVSRFGRAKVVVSLADGSHFSRGADVSETGSLPVFAHLYGKEGFVAGNLQFVSSDTTEVEGMLEWLKPARPTARLFPTSFATNLEARGSKYIPQGKQSLVLEVPSVANNTVLYLGEGNLSEDVSQPATLQRNGELRVSDPLVRGLSVKVSPKTGVFSGKFIHPLRGKTRISGVLFQKENAAFGYFLGDDRSGYAVLSAALN